MTLLLVLLVCLGLAIVVAAIVALAHARTSQQGRGPTTSSDLHGSNANFGNSLQGDNSNFGRVFYDE